MHHYPFHIGDYRAATAHLSNEHDLAYRRLLDMYYDTEAPIPLDTQWVARRLRLETEVVQFVLDDMFERTDDGWHNARCDDELSRYTAIVERNRANGKSGGRPRSARNRRAGSDPKPSGNPLGTQREPSVVLGSRLLGTGSSSQKEGVPMRPATISEEMWAEWLAIRRHKKKRNTAKAITRVLNKWEAHNVTALAGVTRCVDKEWAQWDPEEDRSLFGSGSKNGKTHTSKDIVKPGFSNGADSVDTL